MRVLHLFLSLILLTTTCFGQYLKPIRGMQFVNRTHRLARGLVYWGLFNEGSGNKVFDLSGNGIVGPLGGNVAWTAGLFGSALDLPGDAGDSILTGVAVFDCSKPFTVSCWINPDTAATQDAIWSKYPGSGGFGILLRRRSNTALDVWLNNTSTYFNSTINNGTWYHIVITWDGTNAYGYVNGVLDSAFPIVNAVSEAGLFQIGESSLGHYDGQLDNLMVWQRYFSVSEIAELYREPFGMFQKDNTALIASVEAPPPPTGGQFIIIQMSMIPLFLIFTLVCFIRGKEIGK